MCAFTVFRLEPLVAAPSRTVRRPPSTTTARILSECGARGEAKAVIQDVASYEQTQETLALLKILALGNRQIEEGKVHSAEEVIARLRRGDQG